MNMLESLLFHKPSAVAESEEKRTPNRSPDYGTVQPRILAYLEEHPDSTPATISATLGLNGDSVNRALRKLKADGLVAVSKEAVQCGKVRSAAEWRKVNE